MNQHKNVIRFCDTEEEERELDKELGDCWEAVTGDYLKDCSPEEIEDFTPGSREGV